MTHPTLEPAIALEITISELLFRQLQQALDADPATLTWMTWPAEL